MGLCSLPVSCLSWGDPGEPEIYRLYGLAIGDTQEDLGQHAPPQTVAASAHGCSLVSPRSAMAGVTIPVCTYMSVVLQGKNKVLSHLWVSDTSFLPLGLAEGWMSQKILWLSPDYLFQNMIIFLLLLYHVLSLLSSSVNLAHDTTKEHQHKIIFSCWIIFSLSKTEKSHWKLKVSWPLRTTWLVEKSQVQIPALPLTSSVTWS